ncbi:FAD-dependent oxidoreductase [Amycolatopsis nalaikhensis]|uniref:FAD-dependent oxidoreductase n=1 Tax=Amycolatopsis nalaikhensis TaxID=715472 RepID=A0ABY8XNR2_9PSEU|nr:FAD-dependent oxidoreductase [Amycolatopsis sp. 2-2]WIV57257.1 FAD-dependent oxidoreductase [Amycolatopsis sp. 2-2]
MSASLREEMATHAAAALGGAAALPGVDGGAATPLGSGGTTSLGQAAATPAGAMSGGAAIPLGGPGASGTATSLSAAGAVPGGTAVLLGGAPTPGGAASATPLGGPPSGGATALLGATPATATQATTRTRRGGLRVVVVGGGITGLLTAIRCILAGHHVVLLERGPVPHPGSTSFDQHRALRALVVGDRAATRRAAELHRKWRELDALLCDHLPGAGLYRRVGVLQAMPPGQVPAAVATAGAAGVPLRIVHPSSYPLVGFPRGSGAVLEPHAGTLLADRVLHAAARWLRHHPDAELRPGREAVAIDADRARVELADGTAETGDVVLVAAGPWTGALLHRRVALHRQTMVYLRPPAALAHAWAATPTAGGLGTDGRAWLLPSVAGTLLKVSTDAVRREVTTLAGPDDDAGWAARVLAAGVVSDVDGYDVVRVKHCHYATAEGGDTGFVRVGPAAWARPASGPDGFRTAPLAAEAVVTALAPHSGKDFLR